MSDTQGLAIWMCSSNHLGVYRQSDVMVSHALV